MVRGGRGRPSWPGWGHGLQLAIGSCRQRGRPAAGQGGSAASLPEWSRGACAASDDERTVAVAWSQWRSHAPARETAGRQAGLVEGLTTNLLCRSEGEEECWRRVVDRRVELQWRPTGAV